MLWVLNRLIETVLLSTHNTCFDWEMKNYFFGTHSLLKACELFESGATVYLGHREECVGSVVECLTQNLWVASLSLTGATALCP